ncbi:carboxylesterase family protein [Amycolatopsis endophytica]|uniref:Carboxylic ester hydrolase n=1 Tax=Amycolatopsis endophytica TaxID=860233 RepID=A0A853B810_9PSEU|nr:carboxylesterase family protein [Amycolatopsis endophytica]NYI91448.1 para-nitrobenzyl esterase [Amycolatopsis endophytica]
MKIAWLLVLVLLAATACGSPPAPDPAAVRVTGGLIEGQVDDAARQFLGIRYAQPPTGERRWTLPEPAAPWDGVARATEPGPRCPQGSPAAVPGTRTDEDCLFLNVTTPPDVRPGERLPVVVWWHGGGFTSGSGAEYDARRLAGDGRLMVVTVNYRLGVLGYLGLPGLAGSGNFGFADQVASLRWVHDNAEAFGGDPDNVTVAGQSAGGMAACALLTSPEAALVDRAIVSSGACSLRWPAGTLFPSAPESAPYVPVADNRSTGAAAAASLGCSGERALACLRSRPVADLAPVDQLFANNLAYGTPLLPEDPAAVLREGRAARVPVIYGGTRAEASSFMAGAAAIRPQWFEAAAYPGLIGGFGDSAAAVAARYPLRDYDSPVAAWSAVSTDAAWACPTRADVSALARTTTVYAYEYDDPDAPDVNGVAVTGPAHATDLPLVFDLGGRDLRATPAQRELGDLVVGYWAAFARTGSPGPGWEAARPEHPVAQRLAPGAVAPVDTGAGHRCDFWAGRHY